MISHLTPQVKHYFSEFANFFKSPIFGCFRTGNRGMIIAENRAKCKTFAPKGGKDFMEIMAITEALARSLMPVRDEQGNKGSFGKVLILQILPGTQGLYGLVVWFLALMKLGFFDGALVEFTLREGWAFFGACMPVAIGGFIFALAQGRLCSSSISLMAKRPGELSKGIILAIMVEFYAILALLSAFLMLNNF